MRDVLDYAKYYMQQGLDTISNSLDGNMKLQKILFFTNLVSLAEYGVPFFDEEILAYTQGCVVEKVRQRYRNNYYDFYQESQNYTPDFTEDEYYILDLTSAIFGQLTSRELSEMNHSFLFWKNAYENSIQKDGYKDKSKAVVTIDAMKLELEKIRGVIKAYKESQNENNAREIICGIEFYFTPGEIEWTDDIIDELYTFALNADEKAYSIYMDNGKLVVY